MKKIHALILGIVSIIIISCSGNKVSELSSVENCKNHTSISVSFPLYADSVFGKDVIAAQKLIDFYVQDMCFRSKNDTGLIIDTIQVQEIKEIGNGSYISVARIWAHHSYKEQNIDSPYEKRFSYNPNTKQIIDLTKPVHKINSLQMETGKGELVAVEVRFTSDTIIDGIFGTDSVALESMVAIFFKQLKEECRYEVTFVPRWIQSLEISPVGVDEYGNEIFSARAFCGGYAKNGFGVESEISDFIRIKFSYWSLTQYCDDYIMLKEELDRLLGR